MILLDLPKIKSLVGCSLIMQKDTRISKIRFGVSIILISLTFSQAAACSGFKPTSTLFLPPTAQVDPTTYLTINPAPQKTLSSLSTPQAPIGNNCTNSLLYIEDLTFPDGSIVPPGAEIDKQWRVENNGTCNWDQQYTLRKISGDDLGLEPGQELFPARSGSRFIIQIKFTAPLQAGTYNIVWQAFDPSNQTFGDYLSVLIVVPQ